MELKRFTVIGAGLMGTAFVMEVLKKHPDAHIVAKDIKPEIEKEFYAKLRKEGFGEKDIARVKFTTDSNDIIDPEVVMLAVTPSEVTKAIEQNQSRFGPDTLVMDTTSTKEEPSAQIREALINKESYVPGHMFNGNEGLGPNAASQDIFHSLPTDGSRPEPKPFFIVVEKLAKPGETQQLTRNERRATEFVKSLGSKPVYTIPPTHDETVGTLSHFEYVLAYAFANMPSVRKFIREERGQMDPGNAMTAFQRIMAGNPDMWIPIWKQNRKNILKTAKAYEKLFSEQPQDPEALALLAQKLHEYAKDKPTPRVNDFDAADYEGYGLSLHALLGAVSLGIAANSKRLEDETGQIIAEAANPSYKDGLGFVAKAIKGLTGLFRAHGSSLAPLRQEFQESLKEIVSLIDAMGKPETAVDSESRLRAIMAEVAEDHKLLSGVFAAPEAKDRLVRPGSEKRPGA